MSTRTDEQSGFLAALVPLIEGWKAIALCALLAGLIAAGVIIYRGPRYRASVALVSVQSSKSGGLGGVGGLAAAATLLGGAGGSIGLQSSPALVVKFADLDGVLTTVALSPVNPGSSERVIERMTGQRVSEIPSSRIPRIMRKYMHASYDRTTGIIEIESIHKDSALARTVVTRVLDQTKSAFLRAVRSQATEMREAQEKRVEVAADEMSRAERAMLAFLNGNRQFEKYSNASIERDRLQRELTQAQEVYKNAVADRENARGKELEETPSVAVIDPLPDKLPAVERHLGSITLVTALGCAMLVALLVLMRDSFRKRLDQRDPAAIGVATGLRRIPLVKWAVPEVPVLTPYVGTEPISPSPRTSRTGTGTRG